MADSSASAAAGSNEVFPLIKDCMIGPITQPVQIKIEYDDVLMESAEGTDDKCLDNANETLGVSRSYRGRRFSCPSCPRTFRKERAYRQHVRLHDRSKCGIDQNVQRARACLQCGALFSEWKCVKRHMQQEHGRGGATEPVSRTFVPKVAKRRKRQFYPAPRRCGYSLSPHGGSFAVSMRGNPLLLHAGYRYHREKAARPHVGPADIWRCCSRHRNGCRVRVKCSADASKVYTKLFQTHNHEPEGRNCSSDQPTSSKKMAFSVQTCDVGDQMSTGSGGAHDDDRQQSAVEADQYVDHPAKHGFLPNQLVWVPYNNISTTEYWPAFVIERPNPGEVDKIGTSTQLLVRYTEPRKRIGLIREVSKLLPFYKYQQQYSQMQYGEDFTDAVQAAVQHGAIFESDKLETKSAELAATKQMALSTQFDENSRNMHTVSARSRSRETSGDWRTDPENAHFKLTERAKLLVHKSFTFHQLHWFQKKDTSLWRCSKATSSVRCPVRLTCDISDGSNVQLLRYHNHDPGGALENSPSTADDKDLQTASISRSDGAAETKSDTLSVQRKTLWKSHSARGQYIFTKLGARCVEHCGFTYHRYHEKSKCGDISVWRCSKHSVLRCPARLKCSDLDCSGVQLLHGHNHDAIVPAKSTTSTGEKCLTRLKWRKDTTNAEFVLSRKGTRIVRHRNYIFHKHIDSKIPGYRIFRCNKWSSGCRVKLRCHTVSGTRVQLVNWHKHPTRKHLDVKVVLKDCSDAVGVKGSENDSIQHSEHPDVPSQEAAASSEYNGYESQYHCAVCPLASGAGWPMCYACYESVHGATVGESVAASFQCSRDRFQGGACATCSLASGAHWPICFHCFAKANGCSHITLTLHYLHHDDLTHFKPHFSLTGESVAQSVKHSFQLTVQTGYAS